MGPHGAVVFFVGGEGDFVLTVGLDEVEAADGVAFGADDDPVSVGGDGGVVGERGWRGMGVFGLFFR